MKRTKEICLFVIFMLLSILSMGMTVFANETQENKATHSVDDVANTGCQASWNIEVVDWHRRIYAISSEILKAGSTNSEAIRIYVGENYHLTDSKGDILSEGMYLNNTGNVIEDTSGGLVSRDRNGWYVLWENSDLTKWGEHVVYVQANVDFVGGNNQSIGVPGLSGVYASKNDKKPVYEFDYASTTLNVASEVDVADVHFPVLQGCKVDSVDFLSKASVKMNAVYGDIKDIPINVQWYRVATDEQGNEIETPVGDLMTSIPYYIPESELVNLAEAQTYRVKVFYAGEVSTETSKNNSMGYENIVSLENPMDEAIFEIELVKGHVDVTVQLEQIPYNNRYKANTFSFRLYRFDRPNQMIGDDTPYDLYSVTFNINEELLTKHLEITDLVAGWYTLVPEEPTGNFAEKTEERSDNNQPISRTGGSAGIDFYIGDILDSKYSWEAIRYQGQDTAANISDNFFKITYSYRETVFGIDYVMNLPEGVESTSVLTVDTNKYRTGTKVNVKSGNGISVDGWQFVGWSLDSGDGIYSSGDELYSDISVHGIPVTTQVKMKEGGVTLYAQWVPIYEVNYNGNTHTGGILPSDVKGTVRSGSNLYYEGDTINILSPGNLEKIDLDGTTYIFDGWTLNQDGSGTKLKAGDQIQIGTSDVTLYAQWKAFNTDKYAVNYIVTVPKGADVNGEAPVDDQKYGVDNVFKVKNQGTLQIEHYRFAGWSLISREDGIYQNGEELFGTNDIGPTVTKEKTVMKEQGLSFYSRWIPLYQVIYHPNADGIGSVPADSNEYEAKAMVTILPADEMVRSGYQFIGWNTEMDGSGQSYDVGLKFNMPEENIELYAQWEKLPESETEAAETDKAEEPKEGSVWSLVILAMIGTACITAYIVYQIMSHRKE